MNNNKDLNGLRGWLTLVAIGLIVSPFKLLYELNASFAELFIDGVWGALTIPSSPVYRAGLGTLLAVELVCNIVILLVAVLLLWLFFKRKQSFPKLYIAATLLTLLFVTLDIWFASQVIADQLMLTGEITKSLAAVAVGIVIWIPYMLRSRRVKATFVEPFNLKPALLAVTATAVLLSVLAVTVLVIDEGGDVRRPMADTLFNTDEMLRQVAFETNQALPVMVDENTRLDRSWAKDDTFTYEYTLVNHQASQLDVGYFRNIMRLRLLSDVCAGDESLQLFDWLDATLQFAYYDQGKQYIASIAINKLQDCSMI